MMPQPVAVTPVDDPGAPHWPGMGMSRAPTAETIEDECYEWEDQEEVPPPASYVAPPPQLTIIAPK